MGGMVGGPTIERVSTFNGTEAWDDMQNRGGMGGMQIRMRGPNDGPDGAGGRPLSEEQRNEQRVRRMKTELLRWTVALFADSPRPFTDAGVAESPDGTADVLETTDDADRPVRLFIDQTTHLPLMVQYQEIRPMVMMAGGPGGRRGPGGAPGGGADGGGERPTDEQMQARIEEMRKQGPPKPSQFAMHLADYKKVDGIMLPHRISVSIEGQPNEEWTVEKFKVNPSIKAGDFVKPKA
jgi:hypothetical protein